MHPSHTPTSDVTPAPWVEPAVITAIAFLFFLVVVAAITGPVSI
ncbi:hypothetical protein [Nocardioides yefusunii]|uniref:Uncharacterized protein n=1 Tax=Nocardioides yefusunii TaxID=2500546 RepID=A0ABW1QZK0_9ACTN|nr:hypothetical protein [Nocardioides yefusunii]